MHVVFYEKNDEFDLTFEKTGLLTWTSVETYLFYFNENYFCFIKPLIFLHVRINIYINIKINVKLNLSRLFDKTSS